MKILSGLLLLFLIGCSHSKPKSNKQTLDFVYFTIETPNGWKKIKAKGIIVMLDELQLTTLTHWILIWVGILTH